MADTPYQPVPEAMDEPLPWLQRVSRTVNLILGGKQNVVADLTLNTSGPSTTLSDSRIGVASYIGLTPLTQAAAASVVWVSEQRVGQATINHDENPEARTFKVVIMG